MATTGSRETPISQLSWPDLWNRYAAVYSILRELRPYQELLAGIVDWLVAHTPLTPQSLILDAAGGDGGLLWALQQRQSAVLPGVVLFDSSTAMLERARREPYGGSVTIVPADLEAPATTWGLPGLVDAIHCGHALYATSRPEQVIGQFAQALRPGGLLAISNPLPEPQPEAIWLAHVAAANSQHEPVDPTGRLQNGLHKLAAINAEILRRTPSLSIVAAEVVRSWFDSSQWHIVTTYLAYAGNDIVVIARLRED